MPNPTVSPQNFATQLGMMTDPGDHVHHFDGLPTTVAALRDVVQGLLVHIFWAERYGLSLSDERKEEVNLRPVAQMLPRIMALENNPLTEARSLEKKLVGNCRDFTTMMVAMLRHQGVPARARCGFGAYFVPGTYEDHWVVEYWHSEDRRWLLVDAQLDGFQCKKMGISFDPLDVPRDQFITGGKAWLMCREEGKDPQKFGIFDMRGWAFLRGDLIRDFLALNNIEILPWDGWGLICNSDEAAVTEDIELVDQLARLTLCGDEAFADVRAAFENEPRLHVPAGWSP